MAAREKKGCLRCGAPAEGEGGLCAACAAGPDGAERRVAEQVRDRLSGVPEGDFVCPYCRAGLRWETLGALEAEVTIYVREKIYYCPRCRAFLGVSSWHTEG